MRATGLKNWIPRALADGPATLNELRDDFGSATLKAVDTQLYRLRKTGIVVRLWKADPVRKDGPKCWVYGLAGHSYIQPKTAATIGRDKTQSGSGFFPGPCMSRQYAGWGIWR